MLVQEADTKPFRAICEFVRFEFEKIKEVTGVWGLVHLFISKQGQKALHNFVRNFCPIISYASEIEHRILDVFFAVPLQGVLKARRFFVHVNFVWHSFTIHQPACVLRVWKARNWRVLAENFLASFPAVSVRYATELPWPAGFRQDLEAHS